MVSSPKNSSRSSSPGIAEPIAHPLGLPRDHLGVSAHVLVAQRPGADRLLSLLHGQVEDDAGAEDRLHERVREALIELLVRRTKEALLRRRAAEQRDVGTGQIDLADLATLVADAPEQIDRRAPQLEQMAEAGKATR